MLYTPEQWSMLREVGREVQLPNNHTNTQTMSNNQQQSTPLKPVQKISSKVAAEQSHDKQTKNVRSVIEMQEQHQQS